MKKRVKFRSDWCLIDRVIKSFIFLNAKCEKLHKAKRNPRKITWTVLYRRKHKKGLQEETSRKRTRRAVKHQRDITGASLSDILAKRNQKPEVRRAQREQAIRAAKEKQRAKETSKKATKGPSKRDNKQKAAKPMKAAAPRVGGK